MTTPAILWRRVLLARSRSTYRITLRYQSDLHRSGHALIVVGQILQGIGEGLQESAQDTEPELDALESFQAHLESAPPQNGEVWGLFLQEAYSLWREIKASAEAELQRRKHVLNVQSPVDSVCHSGD